MENKQGTVYRANGEIEKISPANGTDFSMEELQSIVGGTFDIQQLPKTKEIMVMNDNGKLEGLPQNDLASGVWKKAYPIAEYPVNNDEQIVGDVLVCDSAMVQ